MKTIYALHPSSDPSLAKNQGRTLQPQYVCAGTSAKAGQSALHVTSGCTHQPTILQFPPPYVAYRTRIVQKKVGRKKVWTEEKFPIFFDDRDTLRELRLPPDSEKFAKDGNGYIYHYLRDFNFLTVSRYARHAFKYIESIFQSMPDGGVTVLVWDLRLTQLAAWYLGGCPKKPKYDNELEEMTGLKFTHSNDFISVAGQVPAPQETMCA